MRRLGTCAAAGLAGAALGALVWMARERAARHDLARAAPPDVACEGNGSGALAARSVPAFARPASLAERVTALGDRDFDPTKIVRVLSTSGMSARDLFDQEPRDLVWATKLERFLGEAIARDVDRIPGVEDVAVECRTSTCKISWVVAPDQRPRVKDVVGALYVGSAGNARENDLVIVLGGGVLRDIPVGEADRLIDRLARVRAANLRGLHRRAALDGVSGRYLPET